MKRIYLFATLLVVLSLFSLSITAQNQDARGMLKSELENSILKQMPVTKAASQAVILNPQGNSTSKEAGKYSYPDVITHFFSLYDPDGDEPLFGISTHYMTFNSLVNLINNTNYDYLFGYKDEYITYWSEVMASSSFWSIPGGTPATSDLPDIDIIYETAGRYGFPTMTVNDSPESFTRPGNIKIGGKAEISHINMYGLGETYDPGYLEYNNNKGWPGGSNEVGLDKYGNIYTIKQPGTLEAVSLYIGANPTAADPENEVVVNVYAVGSSLDQILLGSSSLKVSEMMAGASSVTGIIGQGGGEFMGMAYFEFDVPVELPDLFFITVENIGNDVAGGDKFIILTDFATPAPADDLAEYLLAWNSFMYAPSQGGGYYWFDYQQVFDGSEYTDNATLYICPVINFGGGDSNILTNKIATPTSTVISTPNSFELTYNADFTSVEVYNLAGQVVAKQQLSNSGTDTLPINLNKGIYMVKFIGATTETVKVVK